jgi:hypothetical protein
MPVILRDIQRRVTQTGKRDKQTMAILATLSEIQRGLAEGYIEMPLMGAWMMGKQR